MNLNLEIKGKGYPILCLHGHPGSARSLSVFTNHLSQRYQTIAPDLRGYGKSRPNGNFQMQDHLDDLETLLDSLKIERCLLLGWSLGGILALELALRNQKRYEGLILIASAARPRGNHPPITPQDLFYTGVAGIVNWIKPGWKWNIETFGKRSLFRYLLSQQTPQAYHYLASDGVSAYLQTSKPAQKALFQALKAGYSRLDDLNHLKIPSLVLAGENDVHITCASSEETAKTIKQCQWRRYPNTAHLFPWEIPTQVLQDIDAWLNTLKFD
ncbi:alpha/beta hydrolase fold protein [Gloeothece citriformis PCC 7424]|uniref:Alpha/beta hydrolase fold protein n=1 Tax=Gloeothece citriformis (strain PCC 7424) TaxID=65393 RepID=B7KLE3_GLOC7|nr:alpha/beta hydrolase [Gloeothece citriformis]ACK72515.1 alpha/beta hydrolase fold protein [Gloeothece citriformis PCC 7424]